MNYKDMNLGKYQECMKVLEEGGEELDIQVKLLAVLGDCTEDEILSLPISKYQAKLLDLNFMTHAPNPKPYCPTTIKMGNQVYTVCKDIEKLTAAQYIDYQSYMKAKNPPLANVLSCFIIPQGKTYCEDYDVMDVIKDINTYMDVDTAIGICFFFRKKSLRSINRTLRYLEWMMRTLKITSKKEIQPKMNEALGKMQELRSLLNEGEFVGLT